MSSSSTTEVPPRCLGFEAVEWDQTTETAGRRANGPRPTPEVVAPVPRKRTRAKLTNHPGPKPVPLEDRFWPKVREDPSGCWMWTGARQRDGYGTVWSGPKGSHVPAHRVAYELTIAKVPAGLQLDHLCRNPSCVNPAHLEPVTLRENILRGESPAALHARKTHCKHGHAFSPENTGKASNGSRMCLLCRRAEIDRATRRKTEARRKRRAEENARRPPVGVGACRGSEGRGVR